MSDPIDDYMADVGHEGASAAELGRLAGLRRPCAIEARCGRPAGHRGHHGGWRSGIAVVAQDPVERVPMIAALGAELTFRELQIVAETICHGRYGDVATCLGLATQTVKNHAASALAKTGATSITNIAYLLGWVTLPAGVVRPHGDVPVAS